MITGDIIRTEEGRRFRMGRVLKAGLIGIVHEGFAIDTEEKIAIKTPVPNLSQDARSRFRQEYIVLKALADKMTDRLYVPWILKGQNETSGEEALVMEYVGEDFLLSTRLPAPEAPGLAREKMALRAAVQYARLLEILHECNYTCQDRKLADLRWLDEGEDGRLVVLDWNVVGTGEAQRADDIYLFGVLWYQLLAGRYPSAILDLLDDSLWRNGAISYGTRRVLRQVLLANSAGRLTSARFLRQELLERQQILEMSGTRLREEGQILYTELDRFLRRREDQEFQPDFNQEWQALDLVDLAYRQGEPVELERVELLRLVGEQGDRLVNQIKQAFVIRQYEEGQIIAEQVLDIAKTTNDNRLILNVARWQLLIQAALVGLNENIFLNKLGLAEPLATFVEHLQDDIALTSATSDLRRLRDELTWILSDKIPINTEAGQILQDLGREIEARQLWLEVSELEEREAYAEAHQKIEQMTSTLDEMSFYGDALQKALAHDLAAWRNELAVKTRLQEILNYWEQQISSKVTGKPYYLEYLLAIDLRTRLSRNEALTSSVLQATLTALPKLNNLYRLRGYAAVDPSLWPAVVRTAHEITHAPDLPDDLKEAVREHLWAAENEAQIYYEQGLAFTDTVALEIYKALQEV